MTPKSNRRSLTIHNETWTWGLATTGVVIISPLKKKTIVPYHTFYNITKEAWYQIEENDNARISVLPSHINEYILNNLNVLLGSRPNRTERRCS